MEEEEGDKCSFIPPVLDAAPNFFPWLSGKSEQWNYPLHSMAQRAMDGVVACYDPTKSK